MCYIMYVAWHLYLSDMLTVTGEQCVKYIADTKMINLYCSLAVFILYDIRREWRVEDIVLVMTGDNLNADVEEESLRRHFTVCGNITNVRVIRDQKTGAGKGFGYVTFMVINWR